MAYHTMHMFRHRFLVCYLTFDPMMSLVTQALQPIPRHVYPFNLMSVGHIFAKRFFEKKIWSSVTTFGILNTIMLTV